MADASAERELSYSEFDAEQKRKIASKEMREQAAAAEESKKPSTPAAGAATPPSTTAPAKKAEPSWRVRVLGGILESNFMEAAMLLLICLDAIVSFLLLLHFDAGVAPPPMVRKLVNNAVYEQAILTAGELFATLAMLESATSLVAHGPSLFAHPGHALDALYIALCLWVSMDDQTFGFRLLGLVRLWRLYRMHLRSVAALEVQLAEASAALDASTLREEQQTLKIQRLEEDVAQAAETRSHHDQVMANYRTQIENLREALEIAASHFVQSTGMVKDQVKVTRKFVVDEAGSYTSQEEIQ